MIEYLAKQETKRSRWQADLTLLLNHEDGSVKFLRNMRLSPKYTASQPKRQYYTKHVADIYVYMP
jgi:hypothetical protein